MNGMTIENVGAIVDKFELELRRPPVSENIDQLLQSFLGGMVCYAAGRNYSGDVAVLEAYRKQRWPK